MNWKQTLGLVLLVACNRNAASESEPAPSPQQAPPPAPQQAAAPGEPSKPTAAAAPNEAPRAGGLSWQDAEPFVRRAPKSAMRAAEYGVRGDGQAELAVFYFGPDQGGSVDANIERWLGQFTQPDGSDTKSKSKRTTQQVNGIEVTVLEATGTYSGGMQMPGGPAPEPQSDSMLLAAIANGPQGPVFFKLVGPRETVLGSRDGFDRMIESLH